MSFLSFIEGEHSDLVDIGQYISSHTLASIYILIYLSDRRLALKTTRLLIHVPQHLKAKLDAERKRGTTAAGLIRHLLEQYLKGEQAA
jgi:hypothetical protein